MVEERHGQPGLAAEKLQPAARIRHPVLQHRIADAIGNARGDPARRRVAPFQPLPLHQTDFGRILSSGFTGEALSAVADAPWPLLRKPYSADALARAIARALDPESQAA